MMISNTNTNKYYEECHEELIPTARSVEVLIEYLLRDQSCC